MTYLFVCDRCGHLYESRFRDPWPQCEAPAFDEEGEPTHCEGMLKRKYTAPGIVWPQSERGH